MALFYFYLISGILLIILELVTTTLYLLVIGIVFILASLITLKFNDIAIISTITIALSLISCFLVYYYKRKHVDVVGDLIVNHVGQDVEVINIYPDRLRVLYSGSQWDAYLQSKAYDTIKVGDHFKIIAVKNNNLIIN